PLSHPLVASHLEQTLLTALLLAQPSNYSAQLAPAGGTVLPRGLTRAVDHIPATLTQPIPLADLVAASGIAGRTLHEHFRRFLGQPPMAYVREARFRQARAELGRAADGETVSAVAWRCGFQHLGRFAAEYRRRFGELPSQTR